MLDVETKAYCGQSLLTDVLGGVGATGIIWLIALVAVGYLAYRSDKRTWNGGVAPSGKPWVRFDTDSQGGRGYTDGDGRYCWISWPGVDTPNAEGKRT